MTEPWKGSNQTAVRVEGGACHVSGRFQPGDASASQIRRESCFRCFHCSKMGSLAEIGCFINTSSLAAFVARRQSEPIRIRSTSTADPRGAAFRDQLTLGASSKSLALRSRHLRTPRERQTRTAVVHHVPRPLRSHVGGSGPHVTSSLSSTLNPQSARHDYLQPGNHSLSLASAELRRGVRISHFRSGDLTARCRGRLSEDRPNSLKCALSCNTQTNNPRKTRMFEKNRHRRMSRSPVGPLVYVSKP